MHDDDHVGGLKDVHLALLDERQPAAKGALQAAQWLASAGVVLPGMSTKVIPHHKKLLPDHSHSHA